MPDQNGRSSVASKADAFELPDGHYAKAPDLGGIPIRRLQETFFNRSNAVPGAVSRKFTKYGVPVALLGDISSIVEKSAPLRDFVRKTNKGRQIVFASNRHELTAMLAGSMQNAFARKGLERLNYDKTCPKRREAWMRSRRRIAAYWLALFPLAASAGASATPWFFATAVDNDGLAYGYAQTSTIDGHAWLFAECAADENPVLAVFMDADASTIDALAGHKTVLTLTNDAGGEVRGFASFKAADGSMLDIAMDDLATIKPALDLFSRAQRRITAQFAPPPADLPASIRFPARGSSKAVADLATYCDSPG